MISLIVAMDANDLIGNENKLPWKLKNDMEHFKSVTKGENIIMGRKTFDSVGILPGRKSYVMSKLGVKLPDNEDVVIFNSKEYILGLEEEFVVIGGSEIYEVFMPYADFMHITVIDEVFEGDAHFPEWSFKEWEVVEEQRYFKRDGHEYDHTIIKYARLN